MDDDCHIGLDPRREYDRDHQQYNILSLDGRGDIRNEGHRQGYMDEQAVDPHSLGFVEIAYENVDKTRDKEQINPQTTSQPLSNLSYVKRDPRVIRGFAPDVQPYFQHMPPVPLMKKNFNDGLGAVNRVIEPPEIPNNEINEYMKLDRSMARDILQSFQDHILADPDLVQTSYYRLLVLVAGGSAEKRDGHWYRNGEVTSVMEILSDGDPVVVSQADYSENDALDRNVDEVWASRKVEIDRYMDIWEKSLEDNPILVEYSDFYQFVKSGVYKIEERSSPLPKDPAMLLEEAKDHLFRGQYGQANSLFQSLQESKDTDSEVLYLMGLSSIALDDDDAAIRELRQAVDNSGWTSNSDALLHLVACQLNKREYADMMRCIKDFLESEEHLFKLSQDTEACRSMMNLIESLKSVLAEGHELVPGYTEQDLLMTTKLKYILGLLSTSTGNIDQAIASFKGCHRSWSVENVHSNNKDLGEHNFTEALLLNKIAASLYNGGYHEESLIWYRKAIERHHMIPRVWSNLALALERSHLYNSGVRAWLVMLTWNDLLAPEVQGKIWSSIKRLLRKSNDESSLPTGVERLIEEKNVRGLMEALGMEDMDLTEDVLDLTTIFI